MEHWPTCSSCGVSGPTVVKLTKKGMPLCTLCWTSKQKKGRKS